MKDVNKIYSKNKVLCNINLRLEEGKVYGFIGRNGAGKTTTMRIITGLAYPTSGQVVLDGETDIKGLTEKRKKIGCIIEGPALNLDMTAKQNLKALCILYGVSFDRIEKILKLVGLCNESGKKVKHFSLGMKQRLGIGMALVNDPKFLILDEPINGLDPDGILEVRNLIKQISRKRKATILVSSHILSELYQMVDNYILINKGEIIENITHEELTQKTQRYVLITDKDTAKVKHVLKNQLKTDDFKEMEDGTIRVYELAGEVLQIMNLFADNGIDPAGISVSEDSLEEYFFKRIGR
ncbi:ATP-binding cassette domain-containing protein [Blautia liquoris]|uniref:ATP-binding cassette domain-containing protein n=1 Tax=Blautia liquoris TaxID=2779518 RepID=UPI001E54DFF7|nr:ATP-binding cassette domain-containing protein [Blautia liquoris]